MAETAPSTTRKKPSGNIPPRRVYGRPFGPDRPAVAGPGRPKGSPNKIRVVGALAAKGLEAKAWRVVETLLTSGSWRARHEAAKTVLAYSIGLPRQTLEITGGIGDLASELAAALAEVRSRRAALPAVRVEVASGERAVNEKGENRPEIGDSRHSTERMSALPILPAEVVDTRQDASGAATVPNDAEHGHAGDRATAAHDARQRGVVVDRAEERSE